MSEKCKHCGMLDDKPLDPSTGCHSSQYTCIRLLTAKVRELEGECIWTQDDDGIWHTMCGQTWVFTDSGTLEEHNFKHCHSCGAKVCEMEL